MVPILAKLHAPVLSLGVLLALGAEVIAGVIMIPVGLFRATKATSKLRRLTAEGTDYVFDESDRWEMIEREGERIMGSLKKNMIRKKE